MRVEPGRACRGRGASLAGITSKGAASLLWVGSPVYTGDQQSKAAKQQQQQQRQRKPSIFLHTDQRLAAVEESVKEMNSMLNGADDTAILTALMSQATSRQNSVEPPVKTVTTSQKQGSLTSGGRSDAETEYWSMGGEGAVLEHLYSECGQPENDYSEPLDSLGRLYASSPVGGEEKRRSEEEEMRWKLRRERFSESNLASFRQKEAMDGEVRGKRKLSLGQFVRKLSRGSLGEGRGDVKGGERLSKLVSRLVGVGRLGSQQVDSSSWEFLSAASSSTNSTPTSTHKNESTSVHQISTTTASYIGQMDSPLKKRESTLEEARSSIAGGNSNRKILGGSREL